ncbi:ParB N-terminal domain-containing protein [Streptomyces albidoflavus]|uniref:ParB N-terminal domain-containing protein n=1 Tax=Streptomyces albidoflavus TaxID=1886 RepID=UPI00224F3152|nr:ParB N-terminal domain-containing protein [Streptomyces albidoflavus]MCX4468693.1 ParB N-terminal domain-containing protein [Streptomyces albidoflavus]WSI95981.1 ParB N-terminal domain-containing protein [Streptomyces albidoflavus]WSI96345.1 ParB N-terminal domain-containing protein [Streptomyces albidoflavus]
MAFTTPPFSDANREMIRARLAEVRKEPSRETVTVEWRGKPRSIDVIEMPVKQLYYNPETHRIKAQRTVDPSRSKGLDNDPWSEASQDYLEQLLMGDPFAPLKEDPAFRALAEDIKEYGQTEPGLITPTGILVNGNTRRAALKNLRKEHIRVGVLPDDWSWDDVGSLELTLQLRKEHKRDYSFINFLLAVDEQVAHGKSVEDICKSFRIKEDPTYKRSRWILAFVKDAIKRSKVTTPDGTSVGMRFVDFERDQGQLEELWRHFTQLDKNDPDGAAQLREARLAGLLLDLNKVQMRSISGEGGGFYKAYLAPRLPESIKPASAVPASVSIPGLSGVIVPGAAPAATEAREFADKILKARTVADAPDHFTRAKAAEAGELIKTARILMLDSVRIAEGSAKKNALELAPADQVGEATDAIKRSVAALTAARSTGGFDGDALDENLLRLRAELEKLAQHASRGDHEVGDGLKWLVKAVQA